MKMLTDRHIKRLFCLVLALTIGFSLLSAVLLAAGGEHAAQYLPAAFAYMGLLILTVMYRYFRRQHQTMAHAIEQLHVFLAGDTTARIECDDEGEFNRLFHEVNSLAAILTAHAENEGRAKQSMKETLSDISHQLKTPLAALNIYNGILQQQADPDTVREFTALSEQELDRIQTLVHNLLTITKLDAGTIMLDKSEHNLSDLIADVKRRFAVQAQQQGTMLSCSGDDAISLFCDAHWLSEAISNLVKNALDHTKAGDTVTVTWRAFASIVQITVQDSGSGIHPEDLPHIFKRFYRSRFSKDTQGVGLGLPLAKAIIEAHSGTIEVDSTLGRGTVFTINLLIPTIL
ncbi:MAG TPA: HAMP domain-containing histidine kinase [Candidatus Agathobaculum merdipullorum]|nr:HAMP domain-containing histidine kinase [Candidatus Agathobaculum merdipullorum]HIY53335.1 HAMP domain-containing histidine kinase [Candidatus Agathobaculum merdavium]